MNIYLYRYHYKRMIIFQILDNHIMLFSIRKVRARAIVGAIIRAIIGAIIGAKIGAIIGAIVRARSETKSLHLSTTPAIAATPVIIIVAGPVIAAVIVATRPACSWEYLGQILYGSDAWSMRLTSPNICPHIIMTIRPDEGHPPELLSWHQLPIQQWLLSIPMSQ